MTRSRRVLVCVAAGAVVLTTGGVAHSAPVAPTATAPAPGLAAPAVGPDLALVRVRDSLLGRHYWYQQTYAGVPVLGGYYTQHVGRDGTVAVADGRQKVTGLVAPKATVAQATAAKTALTRVTGTVRRNALAVLPGATARLVWSVETEDSRRVLVDAASGAVVKVESLVKYADGTGQVFDPNPVVKLQNETLTDHADANSAVPATAYSTVTLHHLDSSGYLRGTYAYMALAKGKLVNSTAHSYVYQRANDFFEQVESYYAVDSVQSYIQSLGFTDVNNEPQNLKPDAITDDNSFYSPGNDTITFGTGGVDDGEDPEVIWHEYGHAVQDDQVPGFGSTSQSGAIGEGFGDYLALTMSQANSPNSAATPWACLMDWDSTSYTSGTPHCIRRADTTKIYPRDSTGEVHDDGEIWSHALYDMNIGLGRDKANKAILEGQFSFTPGTTFAAASNAIVAATQALYGTTDANTARAAFHARGFI
jgi:Zn-dependent metalloprotease